MRGNLESDFQIRNKMDRIQADSETLIGEAIERMRILSTKEKTTDTAKMLESQDPASPKSACSSVTIKSASSGHSSRASSQLRVMRVQCQSSST